MFFGLIKAALRLLFIDLLSSKGRTVFRREGSLFSCETLLSAFALHLFTTCMYRYAALSENKLIILGSWPGLKLPFTDLPSLHTALVLVVTSVAS